MKIYKIISKNKKVNRIEAVITDGFLFLTKHLHRISFEWFYFDGLDHKGKPIYKLIEIKEAV